MWKGYKAMQLITINDEKNAMPARQMKMSMEAVRTRARIVPPTSSVRSRNNFALENAERHQP